MHLMSLELDRKVLDHKIVEYHRLIGLGLEDELLAAAGGLS